MQRHKKNRANTLSRNWRRKLMKTGEKRERFAAKRDLAKDA